MKNFLKKHSKLVIWVAFMVIFNILALVIPGANDKLGQAKFAFWGGFTFINIAFVLIGVVLFALQLDKTTIFNNTVMAYVFSAIYFVITFILNLIFTGKIIERKAKSIMLNLITCYIGQDTNMRTMHIPNENAISRQ